MGSGFGSHSGLDGIDLRAALFAVDHYCRSIPSSPPSMWAARAKIDAALRAGLSSPRHGSRGDTVGLEDVDLIGTRTAAKILGWSVRRVQRHRQDLGGRYVGDSFAFDAGEVRAYRDALQQDGVNPQVGRRAKTPGYPLRRPLADQPQQYPSPHAHPLDPERNPRMPGTQLNEAKQKMVGIRASLRSEVEKIRANPNYTDPGRAREMAMTVLTHRRQAQHLRDNFSSNNNSVRVELTARLFGVPAGADSSTLMVHRDAEDRAARLTSAGEAKTMLTRALERGDTLLARAVAGHAFDRKWYEVAETYAGAKGLIGTLDELASIPSGPLTRVGEAALFAIPAPPEIDNHLGGQSDAVLRNFLNEKD